MSGDIKTQRKRKPRKQAFAFIQNGGTNENYVHLHKGRDAAETAKKNAEDAGWKCGELQPIPAVLANKKFVEAVQDLLNSMPT